mmetsp:Transcript_11912/g.32050  ORF Transcript_11912/g.32050 Transcript_11912/m.32050 type:complete len:122 (-) Transcript_11912:1076-1441(-)
MNEVSSFGSWAFDTVSSLFAPLTNGPPQLEVGKGIAEERRPQANCAQHSSNVQTSRRALKSDSGLGLAIPENCDITSMETPKVPAFASESGKALAAISLAHSAGGPASTQQGGAAGNASES